MEDSGRKSAVRLTRDKEIELQRIYRTEAFRLFVEGKIEDILDTDFYAYLGVTVRTGENGLYDFPCAGHNSPGRNTNKCRIGLDIRKPGPTPC